MRTQEPIRQCFVFAQQAQQQVFGLDIRRAELAGFVTSKKDYSPRLFCVAFKHVPPCERPLLLPPSLLNGPGCVFYRCADPLVCSSGRTYLYLLLFNTSLRVSFSITSALFRSSVLRTQFRLLKSLCFIDNSHHFARCDFLQFASLEPQNASATSREIQVVSNNNRG